MPRRPPPIPVPIASYIGLGVDLLALCNNCQNATRLNPEALIDRYGPGFTTADLRARLRCQRCESRNASLQVNGSPEGMLAGHSGMPRTGE